MARQISHPAKDLGPNAYEVSTADGATSKLGRTWRSQTCSIRRLESSTRAHTQLRQDRASAEEGFGRYCQRLARRGESHEKRFHAVMHDDKRDDLCSLAHEEVETRAFRAVR